MINLLKRAYSRFLFWKWDREYYAAAKRMLGCSHARTMLVDIGAIAEKCCDCWALKLPVLDGSGGMQWTPNCAPAKKAKKVELA